MTETDTTREARAERERASYNEGKMLAASSALHRRFEHAFEGPNTEYGEAFWNDNLSRLAPASDMLEIGCGDGWYSTVNYRKLQPRRLVGIDVSDAMVAAATARGLDARVMDAQQLSFADASFDLVVGRAILHHLEFEPAMKEVHRVLRPGGSAVFMEPLRDNPAWKLFRALTPAARTTDELPLSRQQLLWGERLFGGADYRYIGLASALVGALTSFLPVSRNNPAARLCHLVDRGIERTPLRYWMRYVIVVWRKGALPG